MSSIYTIKAFKTLEDLDNFFKGIIPEDRKVFGGNDTYKHIYDYTENNNALILQDKKYAEEWFGKPVPVSIDEARKRKTYQLMGEYKQIMNDYIRPRLQEFIKKSEAALEIPQLKYNDLGLGTFDFNKASVGLQLVYKNYSIEKRDYVEPDEVENYNDNGKIKRRLKSDKTPVINVPQLVKGYDKEKAYLAFKEIFEGENVFKVIKKYKLKVGGSDAFTSNIKKVYLLKEKKPKKRNAVRVFIKIGATSGYTADMYKWNGYLGVAIADLLSYMGYAVSIYGVYVNSYDINDKGHSVFGSRCWTVCLKDFNETIDVPSLLYTTADLTFFRIKIFDYKTKFAQYYNDNFNTGLGSSGIDLEGIENIVYNFFGKNDKYFFGNKFTKGQENQSSQFIYYIIANTFSLDDADYSGNISKESLLGRLADICLDIVNKNREQKDRLTQEELKTLYNNITQPQNTTPWV